MAMPQSSDFRCNQFLLGSTYPFAPHIVPHASTYKLTILGWDFSSSNPTALGKFNSPDFLELCYHIGHHYLGASIVMPDKVAHVRLTSYEYQPSSFNNYAPSTVHYNTPGSKGTYTSVLTTFSSHARLYRHLQYDANGAQHPDYETNVFIPYLAAAILLDFMSFISQVISDNFHESTNENRSLLDARNRIRTLMYTGAAYSLLDPATWIIFETIIMTVYVVPKFMPSDLEKPFRQHQSTQLHVCTNIYQPHPTHAHFSSPSTGKTTEQTIDALTPLPIQPLTTLHFRQGQVMRAAMLDNYYLSPVTRTTFVPHDQITEPWQSQAPFSNTRRKRRLAQENIRFNQPFALPPTPPRPSTMPLLPIQEEALASPASTPDVKSPASSAGLNTFQASHVLHMATTNLASSKIILDSGAGISGTGDQSNLTDITDISSMSVQGAFGNAIRPTTKGLLGSEQLEAVYVPGMTDTIYSLNGLLRDNFRTGDKQKIAIFTVNGAFVYTLDSCRALVDEILSTGDKTHTAIQQDGIYILRQDKVSHLKSVQPLHHIYRTPITGQDFSDGLTPGYKVSSQY